MDTPPVDLVTDAQILMRLSDATIFALSAGKSKKGFLQQIDNFSKDGSIQGFGVVLNDVDIKRDR